MLKKYDVGYINGMWSTLIEKGTDEARYQFEDAATDAGYELMADLTWRVKA